MIINNKADLNALRGTDAYAEALRRILGATTMWVNDAGPGEPPAWRQQSVGDALAQFDLTTEELLAECEAAGVVPQAPPQPVAPAAGSPSAETVAAPLIPLSRRQFYQALALANYITEAEALAAMAGVIPAPLNTAIDALTDPQEQFTARMLLAGASEFRRDHPLVEIIGAAHGQSSAQIDQFFATAAML